METLKTVYFVINATSKLTMLSLTRFNMFLALSYTFSLLVPAVAAGLECCTVGCLGQCSTTVLPKRTAKFNICK